MGDLLIRNLSDPVHAELKRRAAADGVSLQSYVTTLLHEHTDKPTMHEWIDRVRELPRHPDLSGAEAVRASRGEG